jgi:hypothetical protein
MHPRIKELLIQAIREVGPDDADRGAKEKTLEKFAELVVRECASMVNNYQDTRNPASTYKRLLLEDFGLN